MTQISQQQLFQRFEVIRVLGEGSFGKVFLIRHIQSEIEYAMKKYSKYHIFKNGKETGLIRSARILQALSNRGIIDFIHYIISEEDEIFLIYEACKKGSLEDIKSKLFKIKDMFLIKQIMHQLGMALKYLKSVSVAHRDIKPSNIAFNCEGFLKVIDFDEAVCFKEGTIDRKLGFGEALSIQTTTMKMYSRRSRANSFVGTQIYMAPEMKHRTIANEQADIWAYGCILYELLSGQAFILDMDDEDLINEKVALIIDKLEKDLIKDCVSKTEVIIDLVKKVLDPNPSTRLTIEKILLHEFFADYFQHKEIYENRKRLRKFLRGNYNVYDPKDIIDVINMDLIGMSPGYQIFKVIDKTPIFVETRGGDPIIQQKTELGQRIKNTLSWVSNLFTYPAPKMYLAIGGGRYFKLKNPMDESDKIYVYYDQIESIRIVGEKIVIQCKVERKWKQNNSTWETWQYHVKHLDGEQESLGKLLDAFVYVLND